MYNIFMYINSKDFRFMPFATRSCRYSTYCKDFVIKNAYFRLKITLSHQNFFIV